MKQYIEQLQARLDRLEIMVAKAKQNGDWATHMVADEMFTATFIELKQAEFMEANK
jgi:hypothetical protein